MSESELSCPKCEGTMEFETEYEDEDSEEIIIHFAYNCRDCGWRRTFSKFATVTQEELDSAYKADCEAEEDKNEEE